MYVLSSLGLSNFGPDSPSVLACTPHTCRRSFDVSTERKIQVHSRSSKRQCERIYSSLKMLLQNWRAAVAMLVSVPPTFPGFVDNVKAGGGVQLGIGPRLFDIAFLLGVSSVQLFEELACA